MSKIRQRTFIIILALLASLALFAIFRGQNSIESDEVTVIESKDLTIAQFGDLLLYMPLYIAADNGYFKERGLNVKIVSTGGDDKTYAAVISGSAHFGVADPTFVAIAEAQGKVGKVVGLLINGMPNYGVSVSYSELIKSPSDLDGKIVATVPAPSTSFSLMKMLYESAGLEPAIRQVAPPALMPALVAKEADFALLIEPWVSTVVREGGTLAFSLMDYYPHFALTGITTSQLLVESDPESIRKILSALSQGVATFYNNEQLTLNIAKNRFPNEPIEDLRSGIQRMRQDEIYANGLYVDPRAWDEAIQLRFKLGDLSGSPKEMNTYVDTTFVETL